jgi:type VI secretion system protein ImpF
MQPSLLDRLTETGGTSYDLARRLKDSLLRDLTALLNTRRAEQDFDPIFEQATNSLLTFGVSDLTSYNLHGKIDQERVRQSVERAIRQFEPRLTDVTVTIEQPEPFHPVLMLRVEGVMQTGRALEAVTFEAALDRASRRIGFSGARS